MRDDEEDLNAVWSEHRAATRARLARLRAIAARAAEGRMHLADRVDGQREAHTLAGAAGLFGFSDARALARDIEGMFAGPELSRSTGERLLRMAQELEKSLDRDR